MFVQRQRVEPVYDDALVLPEKLQQRNVHLCLFAAYLQRIGLVLYLLHQIHRYQYERRIAGLHALFRFIPAQEPQCEVQRIRAVFLKADLCVTVQFFQSFFKCVLTDEGAQTVVLEFRLRNGRYQIALVLYLVHLAVCEREGVFRRRWHYFEALTVGYLIFELCEIGSHELHIRYGRTEIQQAVAKAQVEQLALPDHLLGELPFLRGNSASGCVDDTGLCGIRHLVCAVLHSLVRTVFEGPRWHRTYTASPASSDIYRAQKLICLVEGCKRVLFRMSKINVLAGGKVRTFHNTYLVDALGSTFPDRRCVVLRTVRESLVFEPEPGEAMPLYKYYQRVQTYLLDT